MFSTSKSSSLFFLDVYLHKYQTILEDFLNFSGNQTLTDVNNSAVTGQSEQS